MVKPKETMVIVKVVSSSSREGGAPCRTAPHDEAGGSAKRQRQGTPERRPSTVVSVGRNRLRIGSGLNWLSLVIWDLVLG